MDVRFRTLLKHAIECSGLLRARPLADRHRDFHRFAFAANLELCGTPRRNRGDLREQQRHVGRCFVADRDDYIAWFQPCRIGGTIFEYAVSPDRSKVVFITNRDGGKYLELYLLPSH